MLRIVLVTLALLFPAAVSAATCPGADPEITSVVVKAVQPAGSVTHYVLSGAVTNLGASPQASNLLQSVDIFEADDRLDTKSIPPLHAGESYTFKYVVTRSSDAGKGSTMLGFQLDPVSGCSTGEDRYTFSF
jgi:hypothetical protein